MVGVSLLGLSACAIPEAAAPEGVKPQAAMPEADSKLTDLTSYILMRTDAGAQKPERMSADDAAAVLATYDVVFIGEEHRHPGNHLAEMVLFRAIHARAPALSLSMEQFERDVQPLVDDYLAGKIGENPFTDKARAWDNYDTSYRPLVEYAKEHKLPVIAANAPGSVVRCVGKEGLAFFDRITPQQRLWAAKTFNVQDGPYRDKFLGFVHGDAGHGGEGKKDDKAAAKKPPSESALRSFAAQVTRDDTMAESIALHLQKNPGRKVEHLNGYFHSASFLGTVERLQMRMPTLKIAVITPVEAKGSDITVKPEDAKTGTFVLLLRSSPEPYANDDEMKDAVNKQMAARGKTKCEL